MIEPLSHLGPKNRPFKVVYFQFSQTAPHGSLIIIVRIYVPVAFYSNWWKNRMYSHIRKSYWINNKSIIQNPWLVKWPKRRWDEQICNHRISIKDTYKLKLVWKKIMRRIWEMDVCDVNIAQFHDKGSVFGLTLPLHHMAIWLF